MKEGKNMCSLNLLKIGEVGTIFKIDDNLEIKGRLLDMGFQTGSKIECFLNSPFDGPVAYKIKNTIIALRKNDAKKIEVER